MEVSKLIQNMREQGIGIWTEGGKIRYLKKDGKLDDDIKNILIYNKKEIISYFEEERERFDKFPLTDIQMAYLFRAKKFFRVWGCGKSSIFRTGLSGLGFCKSTKDLESVN